MSIKNGQYENGLTVVLLKISTDLLQIQNDPILPNPAKTFLKNL